MVKKTGELEIIGTSEKTGTIITFQADPEIFTETTEYDYETVKNRLRELAFLNSRVKIYLKDERSGEKDKFHASGGVVSYVQWLNRNRTALYSEPIHLSAEKEQVEVEVAFQYFDGYSERLFSFSKVI